MNAVKLSPKFQVVIPSNIRKSMHLQPGQNIEVVACGNRIELVPLKKIASLKGILSGINTSIDREDDRV